MADPLLFPDSAVAQLRALDERVRTLERSNRLQSGSTSGTLTVINGAVTIVDATGVVQATLGRLPDGSYGVLIGPNTVPALRLDNVSGMTFPELAAPFNDPNLVSPITAGIFTNTRFRTTVGAVSHRGIRISYTVDVPAATTAVCRIGAFWTGGSAFSDQINLSTGGVNGVSTAWLHQIPNGAGNAFIVIQAARTGGAGTVNVGLPTVSVLCGPAGCSTGGVTAVTF